MREDGSAFLLPYGDGERCQADADVLEGVQQEDSHDDGEEAAQRSNDVIHRHVLPLFEEDGGAGEDGGGEEDVVDGRDQGGVEDVQRFVQVVDLRADTSQQAQQEEPRQWTPAHVPAA